LPGGKDVRSPNAVSPHEASLHRPVLPVSKVYRELKKKTKKGGDESNGIIIKCHSKEFRIV
jgi:hypothetical protein